VSSKVGVVTEGVGEEIRGSGELGILGVQFKRGINAMFLILRQVAIHAERS
jgi:hypothetical protein